MFRPIGADPLGAVLGTFDLSVLKNNGEHEMISCVSLLVQRLIWLNWKQKTFICYETYGTTETKICIEKQESKFYRI